MPTEPVADFRYLDSRIRSIHAGGDMISSWQVIDKQLNMWLFQATVEFVDIYGGEFWYLKMAQERLLANTYIILLRKAFNISYVDYISNKLLSLPPASWRSKTNPVKTSRSQCSSNRLTCHCYIFSITPWRRWSDTHDVCLWTSTKQRVVHHVTICMRNVF